MNKSIIVIISFISILLGTAYAERNEVYKADGSGAIDISIPRNSLGDGLLETYLHLVTHPSTSENFIIQVDSVDGSRYDFVLYSVDLSGTDSNGSDITDIIYSPENKKTIPSEGDYIDFTWTNTDGVFWGIYIISK